MNKNNEIRSLPKKIEERRQIIDRIKQQLEKLKYSPQFNEKQIKTLQLRLKLILTAGQLTQTRIDNLEEIFQYYCTHIFKTGKFMTFQRLQYEKTHLTLDRFFIFLKDFKLTFAQINQKTTQILQKNLIVKNFKIISSNSRDLSFEQFISFLEKISLIYYNELQHFAEKKEKREKQKLKRIQYYKNKVYNKLKSNTKKVTQINTQHIKQQLKQKLISQQAQHNEQQHLQIQEKGENDDLINELMKDSQLDYQNDQIEQLIDNSLKQLESLQRKEKNQSLKNTQDPLQSILNMTNDEKIEYFYQMMSIDNINEYRKKMSNLGHPIFSNKPSKKRNYELEVIKNTEEDQGKKEQNQRIIQLKQRLEERKQKPKQNSKKILKDSQRIVKDRTVHSQFKHKQEEQNSLLKNGKLSGPVSLSMINKLSLQELKIPKFQPSKLFTFQEQDAKFLAQYSIPKTRTKILSSGVNLKQSKLVVDGLRKRAKQLQNLEKKEQKKLSDLSKRVNYQSHKLAVKF